MKATGAFLSIANLPVYAIYGAHAKQHCQSPFFGVVNRRECTTTVPFFWVVYKCIYMMLYDIITTTWPGSPF